MSGKYRYVVWFLLVNAALLIQTSLLPHVFPEGYVPSMVLPLVVSLAFHQDTRNGAALGILAGLTQDVWAGRLIGFNALLFGCLGFAVSYIQSKVVHDPIFVPGLLAGMAELFLLPSEWVLLRLFGYGIPWSSFIQPLPYWILFVMLMTPAIGGIVRFSKDR